MYTELILRSKSMAGERIYPDESRLLISEALTGKEVDPMLFGREKDGKTHGDLVNKQSPLAPIMFDGGKGFVRIYAVGKAGIDMLNANIGTIYDAMTTHSKTPIVMEIKSGNLEYRPKGDCVYRIPKLGLAKRHKIRGQRFFEAYDRWKDATPEDKKKIFAELHDMIIEAIDKGLAANADQLGDIDLPRNLDIEILDGELGINQVHKGKPGAVGCIRNLRFSLRGELYGPWAVGHLRNHGYGIIRREINK